MFAADVLNKVVPKEEIIAKFRKSQSVTCREENLLSGPVNSLAVQVAIPVEQEVLEGWAMQILTKIYFVRNSTMVTVKTCLKS